MLLFWLSQRKSMFCLHVKISFLLLCLLHKKCPEPPLPPPFLRLGVSVRLAWLPCCLWLFPSCFTLTLSKGYLIKFWVWSWCVFVWSRECVRLSSLFLSLFFSEQYLNKIGGLVTKAWRVTYTQTHRKTHIIYIREETETAVWVFSLFSLQSAKVGFGQTQWGPMQTVYYYLSFFCFVFLCMFISKFQSYQFLSY